MQFYAVLAWSVLLAISRPTNPTLVLGQLNILNFYAIETKLLKKVGCWGVKASETRFHTPTFPRSNCGVFR